MPDPTNYETGARAPVEKTQPDVNEEVSQDAATNKVPPLPFGNSEKVNDVEEEARHSDGQGPPFEAPPSPSTGQVAGVGPATAEHAKDAPACVPNRQPGAYVDEDPLPNLPDGGASAAARRNRGRIR